MKSRIAAMIGWLFPICCECHQGAQQDVEPIQYLGGSSPSGGASTAFVCKRCAIDHGYHLYMRVGVFND